MSRRISPNPDNNQSDVWLTSKGIRDFNTADPDDPEGEAKGESILKEITSILTDKGIPSIRINREVQTGSDVSYLLQQAARNHDLIVLGETEQDIGDRIFGPVNEYIADKADVPVLTVR